MKKKTTNRYWLLGLLVGLVMLVGVSPAFAGYMLLGDFCDSASIVDGGTTFTLAGQTLVATPDLGLIETKQDGGPYDWTDWDGKYEYIVLKQGSCIPNSNGYTELYKFVNDPGINDFNSSHEGFSDPDKLSHISGYNQVPIPGAVWLLGSGLGAFFVARRRKKQS